MARILIIDDDVNFLKMLRQMLERAGHTVLDAPNGKIGAQLFREDRTEIIITDIFMPEKDGIELLKELKKDFPTVRMIAMSGGGRKSEFAFLEIAEMFGADRSFTKPFERQELLGAIQEFVNERQ